MRARPDVEATTTTVDALYKLRFNNIRFGSFDCSAATVTVLNVARRCHCQGHFVFFSSFLMKAMKSGVGGYSCPLIFQTH